MKEYVTPEVDFIELNDDDIVTSSYICPNSFGNTCTGNPYAGT